MRKPFGEYVMSQHLKDYLVQFEHMGYEQFGFSDIIKQEAKSFYEQYYSPDSFRYPDVIFNSEFCQPFLFWNKEGELDISGVLEYDSTTQNGVFKHNTKDGVLIVNDVHSYHTYLHCFDKYLPNHSTYVAEYDEVKDIYLAAVINTGTQFDLVIYHNLEKVHSVSNVFECVYAERREGISYKYRNGYIRYSIYENPIYKNYLLDINTFHLYTLDDSNEIPSPYIPAWGYGSQLDYWWQQKRKDIIDDNKINIYIHLDNSKTSQVLNEFIKNADNTEVLDNIFEEDDTINLRITYNISRNDDIGLVLYCASLYPRIFGYGIMGFSLDELQIGTKNHYQEYKNVYKYSEYYLSELKRINLELYKKTNQDIKPNCLPTAIYANYISSQSMIKFLEDTCKYHFNFLGLVPMWGKKDKKPFKNKYDGIYHDLAKNNNLTTKWKNEYELYKTVVNLYPDTIYQYNNYWLGAQTLDIYIPSLNIGIEYQGLQHYKAIEFFGGEKQLKAQIERDNRKRILCEENGVKLIYWRYDEPISPVLVKRRIVENI